MDLDFNIYALDEWDNKFLTDLERNLRQQDKDEMDASGIDDYYTEIMETVKRSQECFKVVAVNGMAIAGFGIIPALDGGQIWFLGTNLLKKYRKSFIKISKKILSDWAKEYGRLFNFVSAANTDTIKWLTYLGAEMNKKIIYREHVFIRFEIERMR